jgi:hypothetical protein
LSYDQLIDQEQEATTTISMAPSKSFLSLGSRRQKSSDKGIPLSRLMDFDRYIRTNSSKSNKGELEIVAGASAKSDYFQPFDNYSSKDFKIGSLNITGMGQSLQVTAYGSGSMRLEGKTYADYDGGSYSTANVKVRSSEECECGEEDKCIRAKGTLNAKYSVSTRVTLPSVSQYPNLTAPQKKRLQQVINSVLAPHEQKHVAAFRKYNGKTSRPFDLTICRSEFDDAIHSMFLEEASLRQQTVQAESDSLDPFFFEFQL